MPGTAGTGREHVYADEHGAALFKAVIGGRRQDGKKIVWLERPDGRGGWVNGTEGVRRVIYRRFELQGKPSVVTEEEKDADRLWSIGIPATTNVGRSLEVE